jgi:uncharacterized protein YigE (DUF2233 family)
MKALLCGFVSLLALAASPALDFRERTDPDGHRFTVCTARPDTDRIGLFLADKEGHPLETFAALRARVEGAGQALLFAMNAGMYEADFSPVGLFVVDGQIEHPLNLRPGTGNFYLPNGVFLVAKGQAAVVSSPEFAREWSGREANLTLATQSGPLLLHRGVIAPFLQADSSSRFLRNGVGISTDGKTVYFAITDDPVNLWEMARFFRDALGCPDALYFDGNISSLYAPPLQRDDRRASLGPMIGIVR